MENNKKDFNQLHKELINRVLEGRGMSSRSQRYASFNNAGLSGPLSVLVDKVAQCAYKITDQDFAAVRASDINEDQIFELVICASVGQATRQYRQALDILNEVADNKKGSKYAS
jgi:hypothetical protein